MQTTTVCDMAGTVKTRHRRRSGVFAAGFHWRRASASRSVRQLAVNLRFRQPEVWRGEGPTDLARPIYRQAIFAKPSAFINTIQTPVPPLVLATIQRCYWFATRTTALQVGYHNQLEPTARKITRGTGEELVPTLLMAAHGFRQHPGKQKISSSASIMWPRALHRALQVPALQEYAEGFRSQLAARQMVITVLGGV